MDPKPNEIWKTKLGNYVLVVEHPMTEVEGNLGFIWFDTVDNNLNFSPLKNQLAEKMKMTVGEWGGVMGDLTDPERLQQLGNQPPPSKKETRMSNAYEALCAIYDRGRARINSVVRPTLIGKERADLHVLVRSMSENVATVVINYVSQVLNGGHQQWADNDYLIDDHEDLLNVLAMINGPYCQKVANNVKEVLDYTGEEMIWPYDDEDDDPLGHLDIAFYTYDKEFCQEVLDWIRAKDIETAKALLEAGSEAL